MSYLTNNSNANTYIFLCNNTQERKALNDALFAILSKWLTNFLLYTNAQHTYEPAC